MLINYNLFEYNYLSGYFLAKINRSRNYRIYKNSFKKIVQTIFKDFWRDGRLWVYGLNATSVFSFVKKKKMFFIHV